MSWDADFDGGSWNYTHNTNAMIAAALEAVTGAKTPELEDHPLAKVIGPTWYKRLDGLNGREGADLLAAIITGLEADPDRYRAMNPENGWGSYDGVLTVLKEMREASGRACCDVRKWSVSG